MRSMVLLVTVVINRKTLAQAANIRIVPVYAEYQLTKRNHISAASHAFLRSKKIANPLI